MASKIIGAIKKHKDKLKEHLYKAKSDLHSHVKKHITQTSEELKKHIDKAHKGLHERIDDTNKELHQSLGNNRTKNIEHDEEHDEEHNEEEYHDVDDVQHHVGKRSNLKIFCIICCIIICVYICIGSAYYIYNKNAESFENTKKKEKTSDDDDFSMKMKCVNKALNGDIESIYDYKNNGGKCVMSTH